MEMVWLPVVYVIMSHMACSAIKQSGNRNSDLPEDPVRCESSAPLTLDIDCTAVSENGQLCNEGGVRIIKPEGGHPLLAFCRLVDGQAWTVIQRRVDGSVDFNRNWNAYKEGFGSPGEHGTTDYWIGLENLYKLTNQKRYVLHIRLKLVDGREFFATYSRFHIDDEESSYRLHIDGYDGDAGDAFNGDSYPGGWKQNGVKFSTPDRDNDNNGGYDCAQTYRSGYWFNACYYNNLNGPYVVTDPGVTPRCPADRCIRWDTIPDHAEHSISYVEMRVLPADAANN